MRQFRLAVTAVTGLALFAPLGPPTSAAVPAVPPRETVDPSYQELALRQGPGTTSATAAAPQTKPFGLVGVTWPYRASSRQVVAQVRAQRKRGGARWGPAR